MTTKPTLFERFALWVEKQWQTEVKELPLPPPPPPLPYADERWCKKGMTLSDVIRETETRVIELQHRVAELEARLKPVTIDWIDGPEPELDEEPGANWSFPKEDFSAPRAETHQPQGLA